MGRTFITLSIVLFLPLYLWGQQIIEVDFDPYTSSVSLADSTGLEAGNRYQLKILNVNPAYLHEQTWVRSYRYISPIPEILEPILPGIPGTDIFDYFDIRPSGQREFFLKSLRFYNELEVIRSASDELYTRTRYHSDPEYAAEILDRIHTTFDTTSLQYIVGQVAYYQDYILAAESIYANNIDKVTLMTPDADVVIREKSRLSRIAKKIQEIDYGHLLEYIAQSTTAPEYLLTDVFTAKKDLTEVRLALYDSYVQDTIFTGTLRFDTEHQWTFDFSTGLFFTNLYEKDFYLTRRNDEVNDVLEEGDFKGDMSVGAMAHLAYKINPNFRLGPAVGASISPFDGNIRYLLGFGALIGKEKIVGISAGISIGQIEELSGAVVRDGFGPYLPINESRIPTYTKTIAGMFLGITYNFTRQKK